MIKLDWLNYPYGKETDGVGTARFKIGEEYHHVQVTSVASAQQIHKLLQHAHKAGMKMGEDFTFHEQAQRVRDLLSG